MSGSFAKGGVAEAHAGVSTESPNGLSVATPRLLQNCLLGAGNFYAIILFFIF
jgi:hypothetical protein